MEVEMDDCKYRIKCTECGFKDVCRDIVTTGGCCEKPEFWGMLGCYCSKENMEKCGEKDGNQKTKIL